MRSAKPYSNVTFTKRVDHDGGRHRPPRAPAEPAFCPGCGAVYANRRWNRSRPARMRATTAGEPMAVRICSSCHRRRTGVPHGYVHIDGEFFPMHRAELERMLDNEVEHAREDNPLQQVIGWEDLDVVAC